MRSRLHPALEPDHDAVAAEARHETFCRMVPMQSLRSDTMLEPFRGSRQLRQLRLSSSSSTSQFDKKAGRQRPSSPACACSPGRTSQSAIGIISGWAVDRTGYYTPCSYVHPLAGVLRAPGPACLYTVDQHTRSVTASVRAKGNGFADQTSGYLSSWPPLRLLT